MNNQHEIAPGAPESVWSKPEMDAAIHTLGIRCPSCGRLYDPPGAAGAGEPAGPAPCRRCETDLTPLVRLAAAATRLLERGARLLAAGKWTAAIECAELAWQLRHDPRAAELGLIAGVAAGGAPETIRRWLRRCEAANE